jgi:hypothetical protein
MATLAQFVPVIIVIILLGKADIILITSQIEVGSKVKLR